MTLQSSLNSTPDLHPLLSTIGRRVEVIVGGGGEVIVTRGSFDPAWWICTPMPGAGVTPPARLHLGGVGVTPPKRSSATRVSLTPVAGRLLAVVVSNVIALHLKSSTMQPASPPIHQGGEWQQRRKPVETARLKQWKRAAENLERGGTLLVNYAAGLTSNHIIAEAEKSEKRAAAALSSAASAAAH